MQTENRGATSLIAGPPVTKSVAHALLPHGKSVRPTLANPHPPILVDEHVVRVASDPVALRCMGVAVLLRGPVT
jgi:hypothetical protein